MLTITILNEKGGVGKTTVAVTVAAGLASRGKRVLLIDADAQGHATISVRQRKYPGLYDLLVRWRALMEQHDGDRGKVYAHATRVVDPAFYGGGNGVLAVIGGNVETRNIATSISDADAFAARLEALRDRFDYCIIDTAPTPSLLHGSIYMATDWVIYPTLLEHWALDGLAESLSHLRAMQTRRAIRVAGIVPVRMRTITLEHRENLAVLHDECGVEVWKPVPDRIVWAEAATYQRPVFLHAPDSPAAGDAWELVDRVEQLGVTNGE